VLNCSEHYDAMSAMMDYGFANFESVQMGTAGEQVGTARVINGDLKVVPLILSAEARVSASIGSNYEVKPVYDIPAALEAPIQAGTQVGTAVYTDEAGNKLEIPVLVRDSSERYTFRTVFKEVWNIFLSVFMGQKN